MFSKDDNVEINVESLKSNLSKTGKKLKKVTLLGATALVLSGCGNEMPVSENTQITYSYSDGHEEQCSSISDILDKTNIKEIEVVNLRDSSDIEGIKDITGLESIRIVSPTTDNLSPLKGTTTESIEIIDATFHDWTFLEELNGVNSMEITHTNLSDTSFLTFLPEVETVDLSNNFITEMSDKELDNLEELSIENNSVKDINLSKYPSIKRVYVEGNYNLYNKDIYDYVNNHGISIDFSQEEINYINQIKEDISKLGLDSTNQLENEKKICDYVIDKMEYDKKLNDSKVEEYNENLLKYFVEGKGVCANYASGLDACLELSGINSYTISGYIGQKNASNMHRWNILEINGQYFLCDITNSDYENMQKYYELQNYIISTGSNPKLNAVGENYTKAFKKYHEVRYGEVADDDLEALKFSISPGTDLKNSHGTFAEDIKSSDGLNESTKDDLHDLIQKGSLYILSGLIADKIFRDVFRSEIERKQRIKERNKKEKKESKLKIKESKKQLKIQKKELKRINKENTKRELLEKKKKLKEEKLKIKTEKKRRLEEEKIKKEKRDSFEEIKSQKNSPININDQTKEIPSKSIDSLLKELSIERLKEEEQAFLDRKIDIKRMKDMSEEELERKISEIEVYMKSRIGKSPYEKALMDIKRDNQITEEITGKKSTFLEDIDLSNVNQMSNQERDIFNAYLRKISYSKSEEMLHEFELRLKLSNEDNIENNYKRAM